MAGAVGNAKGINLNTARPEELDRIGGLGQERVHRLTESRPFHSWDDLKRVEGFSETLVRDLQQAGASI